MTNLSILIVDDEPDNFDVIEALLDRENYQLHYAATGYKALESLATIQPDLILLDVMMPGIDGIELCRQIKAQPQWKAIPIIMITALSAKADLANCIAAGADDFVSKPVNAIELRARIQSMTRIKQQYDQLQTFSRVQKNTIHLLEKTLGTLHGNIASTLSHELNTPLNGILGTVELMQLTLDTASKDDIREMLQWVEESGQRLDRLTKKFRTYLELELLASQNRSLEPGKTKLPNYELLERLKQQAQKAGRADDIKIHLENTQVALSEHYLLIIFDELLDNALKFSPRQTMIRVEGQVRNGFFQGCVHNSGRGMTEEQIAAIGAFMQFDRDVYEQQGIGMGLRSVKQIVELTGGNLAVESVPQEHITIRFNLPVALN